MSDHSEVPLEEELGLEGDDETADASSAFHVPALMTGVRRVGVWSWSFVGLVIALTILVFALAAVSEIALPMTFAAVLAVMFKPLVGSMIRKGLKPSLAAGLIVLGLLFLVGGTWWRPRGVIDQADQIGTSADAAIDKASDQTEELGIDKAALEDARKAVEDTEPVITGGVISGLVSGISAIVAVAGGLILGALIMFYMLKDGARLRRSLVDTVSEPNQAEVDSFIGHLVPHPARLRQGADGDVRGRLRRRRARRAPMGLPLVFTIMVVNFVGGYIPYIGAFLGGGLAVVIALGEGGLPPRRSCSSSSSPRTCCSRTSSSRR